MQVNATEAAHRVLDQVKAGGRTNLVLMLGTGCCDSTAPFLYDHYLPEQGSQAVGRIGNWWNQELFGKPTGLPWGLEIDPVHRPLASIDQATYHPAFLYELVWNLVAAALLVYVIERRFHPRPPGLFALYIALYSFGRFWIELVRVDPANHILGQRVNTWVSGLVCLAGLVWFWLSQRRGTPPKQAAPPAGPTMAVPKSRVRQRG